MYIWMAVVNPIALVIAAEVFIPVFYRLQVKTTYEYLGTSLDNSFTYNGIILHSVLTLVQKCDSIELCGN